MIIPAENDLEGAEIIARAFNERGRAGRLYYRTRIHRNAITPLIITTLDYQPSGDEVLVGQYQPPITVGLVMEDTRRALYNYKEPPVQPLPADCGIEKRPASTREKRVRRNAPSPAPAKPPLAKGKTTVGVFLEAYCEKEGKPWSELQKTMEVVICNCGNDLCQGWVVVPKAQAESQQEPETPPAATQLGVDAEQYSFSAIQKKFEDLKEEKKSLIEEIESMKNSIEVYLERLTEVEEKLKSINKICQLANEVMNED